MGLAASFVKVGRKDKGMANESPRSARHSEIMNAMDSQGTMNKRRNFIPDVRVLSLADDTPHPDLRMGNAAIVLRELRGICAKGSFLLEWRYRDGRGLADPRGRPLIRLPLEFRGLSGGTCRFLLQDRLGGSRGTGEEMTPL